MTACFVDCVKKGRLLQIQNHMQFEIAHQITIVCINDDPKYLKAKMLFEDGETTDITNGKWHKGLTLFTL